MADSYIQATSGASAPCGFFLGARRLDHMSRRETRLAAKTEYAASGRHRRGRRRGGSHVARAASETWIRDHRECSSAPILLALIVIGTFTAFDSSNRFTANEQDRSQASSLAQQDQDRLRGLQVSQLSTLNATRTVTLNGTTFTVTSTGQFQSDATGTSSCGGSGTADYIKTTSTVTWPAMGDHPAGRRREHHHATGRWIADRAGGRRGGRSGLEHGGHRQRRRHAQRDDRCRRVRRSSAASTPVPTTWRCRSPGTSTRTATRLRRSASRPSPSSPAPARRRRSTSTRPGRCRSTSAPSSTAARRTTTSRGTRSSCSTTT